MTEPNDMLRILRAKLKDPKDEAVQWLTDLAALVVEPQYQRTVEGIRDWFDEHGFLTPKQMAPVKINARKQNKTIPQYLLTATEAVTDSDKDDTMEFEIEKNIPFPSVHGKYPFNQMEVGDSIFIPGMRVTDISSSLAYQKTFGRKFASRTVDGGIRVWRRE